MDNIVLYVYVSSNGRRGYVLDNQVMEVVDLPKAGPPSTIVRCQAIRPRKGRTKIVSYHDQNDYVLASSVRVELDGDEAGLVGVADPELWTGRNLDLAIRTKTSEGTIVAVPVAQKQSMVTHYVFGDLEKERDWIVDRVISDQPVKTCSGGRIQFSEHFRALLDWRDDSAAAVRLVRDQRHQEVEELEQQRRDVSSRLAQVQAEAADAQRALETAQVKLQHANEELEQVADKTIKLQKKNETLDQQLAKLEASARLRRSELDVKVDDLKRQQTELSIQVEHLRIQERTGVVLDESASRDRVELLEATTQIEDESEAVAQLVDRLAARADAMTTIGMHVALKHCPFVVLTGPSGSGKSSLLSLYAQAFGMASEIVAVQPNWTSSADLHGYVVPIGTVRHFVTTPFTEVLGLQFAAGDREYGAHVEAPFVSLAILDEINLAHVEYYLADYLSALESEAREVSIASPLELGDALVPLWLRRLRGRVRLPSSFLFAGTANEDHTTQGFSDKFRDRAGVLEIRPRTSDVGTAASTRPRLAEAVGRVTPSTWQSWRRLPEATSALKGRMSDANKVLGVLRADGFHVGHRIVRDVEVLMRAAHPLLKPHVARSTEKEAAVAALDLALSMRVVQKFVPLVFKRTGWSADGRRSVLKRLGESIPRECESARRQLADAQS